MKIIKGENVRVKKAAEDLRAVGFIVEENVSFALGRSSKSVQADLVAWATDETGTLVRDVVVEVKEPDAALASLAQLSRVASVAGARRAFIFTGDWLAVDPSFAEATLSTVPRPLKRAGQVRVPRVVIEKALSRLLWDVADETRSAGGPLDKTRIISALLDRLERTDTHVDLDMIVRTPGMELTVARLLAEGRDEFGTLPELTSALARLLGPRDGMTILDPFCSVGGCLLAVAEEAREHAESVTLHGWYPNDQSVVLARRLAAFAKLTASVETHSILPPLLDLVAVASGGFDGVISVLPFNTKVNQPIGLSTGEQTHSLDVAMLDSLSGWLKPNGRAVVVAAPRLLFVEGEAARVRARLANTMRVVAVIELPSGVFANTQVKCGVLVIEKKAPTDTLVARLTDDWREQLSSVGAFWRDYQAQLHGVPSA